MKKSEMFGEILDKVCDVCEVKRESVINGVRIQAVVDARVLAVQYLKRIGLSDDDIALMTLREMKGDSKYCPPLQELKSKAKGISKMFSSYSERCLQSYSFCLMSVEIKEFCRQRYADFYCLGMKKLPN